MEKLLLKSVQSRFWSKVDKQGLTHPVLKTRCWEWTASKVTNSGYGQFQVIKSTTLAHRISWLIHFGEIPTGLFVLHKCDNKICVNPDHIFLGTHQANMDDCKAKGRNAVGDRNGTRKYPERIIRGDAHYSRRNPELMSRGEAHSEVMLIHSPKGESHYGAKLTEEKVRWLRDRYAQGDISITELAKIVGLSRMPVWQAIRKQTWKHIK